jgi:cytochrome c553
MTVKISKKIKGYSVVKPEDQAKAAAAVETPADNDALELRSADIIQMHEKVERPDVLVGSTYKIKSPLFEHALYVTINDIVLNPGTEHESRRPFEIFINSKNMDHFQWVVAITRIMSAVFRKGGDVTFLVEELKAVFDPRGGYFKAGGIYMPSIVAEIGAVVEDHLKMIGMIVDDELSPEQKRLIAEKRAAYEASLKKNPDVSAAPAAAATAKPIAAEASGEEASGYPPGATMCGKCHTKAMVIMDGCATCLSCGYSKCG